VRVLGLLARQAAVALCPASTMPKTLAAAKRSGWGGGDDSTLVRSRARHAFCLALLGNVFTVRVLTHMGTRVQFEDLDAKGKAEANERLVEGQIRRLTEVCMRSSAGTSLVRVPKAHERDLVVGLMALKVKTVQVVAGGTLIKGHKEHKNVGRHGRRRARARFHRYGRAYEVGIDASN